MAATWDDLETDVLILGAGGAGMLSDERAALGSGAVGGGSSIDLAVVVCTYRRNEPLRQLLERLDEEAARSGELVRLGVAIVDDSPTGEARAVADRYGDRFALGVSYTNTASGNISTARNAAIDGVKEARCRGGKAQPCASDDN